MGLGVGAANIGDATMTMTIEQLRIAISEAANYTDVDCFVDALLRSPAFAPPGYDYAELDPSQSADLRKVWVGVNAPFGDFIAEFSTTQTQLARQFGIPLRTIQEWAGELRHCPIYVRKMMATLLILDNTMQDVAPISNEQIADIIDLYNRSASKCSAALAEMDSDNAKISASEMDTIERMLSILGYKIIYDDDDGSDEAIDT